MVEECQYQSIIYEDFYSNYNNLVTCCTILGNFAWKYRSYLTCTDRVPMLRNLQNDSVATPQQMP